MSSIVRSQSPQVYGKQILIHKIDGNTDWRSALVDKSLIIHTAARTSVIKEKGKDTLNEYKKINVDGTLNFATQAASEGVKRFIFLSSIKVNGEESIAGKPFTEKDEASPSDDYAHSKYEAECGLLELSKRSSMEVVIIRPPLVYGPGVQGNFASLIKILQKGIPLPLGAINNKRSLIALDNLVDFILTCTNHPAAKNQVFMISDGQDISTTELLKRLTKKLWILIHTYYQFQRNSCILGLFLGKHEIGKKVV